VLLAPPLRAWKTIALAQEASVSLGLVSNVRKLLLDNEWAATSGEGLRVVKPEALAREWQHQYKPYFAARFNGYTLLHGENVEKAIHQALSEANMGQQQHVVLASYSAAHWLAPFARHASYFFYADSRGIEILDKTLQLKPVERGENVVTWEPWEDGVFLGRVQAAPGVWCSSPLQTWLDLSASGERGREAAEHLFQTKLLPAWEKSDL